MGIQQIIVALIVIGCIVFVVYRIALYFKGIRDKNDPCAGCNSDCKLKDLKKKSFDCGEKKHD